MQTDAGAPLVIKRARSLVGFGNKVILDGLDLDVRRRGAGLRRRLGHGQIGADPHHPRPDAEARGSIEVFGADLDTLDLMTAQARSSGAAA